MKENKINFILYLLTGLLFGIIAIVNFTDGSGNTSGVMYTGLCITFLGIAMSKREESD